MKRVYISGPLTSSGTIAENIHRALAEATKLRDAGYWVYVPHLTYYWEIQYPAPYEMWMEADLALVEVCDALVRLSGISKGADREVQQALLFGIPCYDSVEAFLQEEQRAIHQD